jgi:TonB family protein
MFLCATLFMGCANRATDYIVVGLNPNRLSKADAEGALVQNYLQKQVSQPIDEPLTAIRIVLPSYPQKLVNADVAGTVLIRFIVDETGKVMNPVVIGSAVGDLADLSIDSVKGWLFKPIRQNGKPVRLNLTYEFIFRTE